MSFKQCFRRKRIKQKESTCVLRSTYFIKIYILKFCHSSQSIVNMDLYHQGFFMAKVHVESHIILLSLSGHICTGGNKFVFIAYEMNIKKQSFFLNFFFVVDYCKQKYQS